MTGEPAAIVAGKKKAKKKTAKKVENTCRKCVHSQFPEGDDVKRGICRRYPTHTPILLKSYCGEFK